MAETTDELKTTPLTALHIELGAKMVPFAGYSMPVQFSGVMAEHHAVRDAAGLFDVSHMGQLHLTGPTALKSADRLLTRRVSTQKPGRVRYALLCNEAGEVFRTHFHEVRAQVAGQATLRMKCRPDFFAAGFVHAVEIGLDDVFDIGLVAHG